VLQPTLCCCRFLYKTIDDWRWQGNDDAAAAATKDWEEIFEFLISQLRGDLIDCGNDILRRAAGKGCLVLIKKLFAAGAQDAELRQALITPDDEDNSRGGRSLPISHQSIGEAAFWAHADVVRFLCEQPGLESHLRYRNRQKGDTVFHQAARRPSEAVLRTLIRHWPEGVNIVNEDGDTPLIVLVFSNPSGCEAETARLVRLLLREGKADANPGGSCSALRIAVRGGYTTVARLLVVEGGADVLQVVGIDEETGRPFLRSDMISPEDKRGQEQMLKEQMLKEQMLKEQMLKEQMLRTLCSLLPLAVSVEYLV
jgi:ankyrin repeat protein